jgi:hypothetical protein
MHELRKKSNVVNLAELRELLGPPPILSTENAKAYDEIVARLMQCFAPADFMEQLLIAQLTDCTWEIMRYTRHKPWAIERKFRQHREFQAKRARAAAQIRDLQVRGLAQSGRQPATELGRMLELEEVVDSVVDDTDEILNRPPVELDHARAFEADIVYQEQLDRLLNTAIRRRNDVLEQLERYRDGLGRRLRKASDEIIDAEFNEAVPESKQVAVPLAPLSSEANDVRKEDRGQSDQR